MKGLYFQQSSTNEEITFLFQERVRINFLINKWDKIMSFHGYCLCSVLAAMIKCSGKSSLWEKGLISS